MNINELVLMNFNYLKEGWNIITQSDKQFLMRRKL
ncbi:MAG: hypothetical protein KatS3mg003_0256 [Candidatus Nitrosocaldaceae archaeon]|nr:MAG: hypothetical protein KatS3mg003_0256 [Candidatus Nitrosocaldaceae archaeon]